MDGSFVYYAEDVNGLFDWWYMRNNRQLSLEEVFQGAYWEIFAVKLNHDSVPVERIKLNYYRPYNQGGLDASPDGTKLAFISNNHDNGEDADIYIVSLKVQEKIRSNDGGQIVDGNYQMVDTAKRTHRSWTGRVRTITASWSA